MRILSKIQLLLFISLFFAVAASLISAFRLATSIANQEFQRESLALCLSLKLSSEEALRGYRDFLLQGYVNDTKSQPDVVYAYVQDSNGKILADTDFARIGRTFPLPVTSKKSALSFHDNVYTVSLPLRAREGEGRAVVALSTAALQEKVKRLAVDITAVGLVIGLVVVWLAGVMAGKILSPILRLQKGMRRISAGDLDQTVEVSGRDELAELSRAFNDMAANLKQANASLKKAQLELVHAARMSAVGQLGASVAHEINNPLTSLMGFAQYLADAAAKDPSLSGYKEDLRMIFDQSTRCKNIVENLLQFSRPGDAHLEEVDVNKVIRDSLSLSSYNLYKKGISLKTDLEPELPKTRGIPSQLQQVFINLILNAEKAMGKGGVLRVQTSRAGGPEAPAILISFADTGSGIPSEVLPHIFDPFFTTRAEEGGTGLGLSISREIIARHGGEIGVESQVNQGTTFRIRLPVKNGTDEHFEKTTGTQAPPRGGR